MTNLKKIIYVGDNERENLLKIPGLKVVGDYNTYPRPFHEIDMDRYIDWSRTYDPDYTESRQITEDDKFVFWQIEWYFSYGLAIQYPNNWSYTKQRVRWECPLRYFFIGCEHMNRRELSSKECSQRGIYHAGRCWNVSECLDCGHIEAHDTSD